MQKQNAEVTYAGILVTQMHLQSQMQICTYGIVTSSLQEKVLTFTAGITVCEVAHSVILSVSMPTASKL